jgi:hypothetical protein
VSADACAHPGWTTRARARIREVTTVQLQRRHLRAGRLPVVAVGEELEVAPVLYLSEVDDIGCRPPVSWETGPFGIVGACGVVGAPLLLQHRDGPFEVEILQVGDRQVIVESTELETGGPLEPGRRVFVEGALALDVDLVGAQTSAPVPMRGRYRVAAVRRYRARLPRPPSTEPLPGIPAPEDVDPGVFLHVADLLGPVRDQP